MSKIILTESQKASIEVAALESYPKEMCGFLTEKEFIPCKNVHETPEKAFAFDKLEQAKWFSKAKAVVHSHCKNPREREIFDPRTPSYADILGQKKTDIPWLIVATEGMTVTEPLQIPRVKNPEYLKRKFIWYISDCYSLILDWYWFERGIALPEHVPSDQYTSIRGVHNIFEPYIARAGFVEVKLDSIQEGDLLLLNHAGFTNNHLGIYTKGQVLHQDMISCIVPFSTFLGRINKVLRYVG